MFATFREETLEAGVNPSLVESYRENGTGGATLTMMSGRHVPIGREDWPALRLKLTGLESGAGATKEPGK